MLGRLFERFRPPTVRTQVESAIRRGTGLHRNEWEIAGPDGASDALVVIAEAMVDWCREEMSRTRRPYGIDQLALAVACAREGGPVVSSETFGVFRPIDFYSEGGIAERVSAFVHAIPEDEFAASGPWPLRFAAALFSWGEVARETVFADTTDAQVDVA